MQKGFNKNPITNSQKPLITSDHEKIFTLSLFFHLTRQRLKSSALPLLSRNYISDRPSSSSSPSPPPVSPSRFSPCAITHESVSQNSLFQANPSRNMNTLVETSPQISSRQRKSMEKWDFEEAFESAKTTEEMLAAFKAMESAFEERELGMAALKVGLKLDQEGEDPEKALSFATRALKALDRDDSRKPSLVVAMALQLMGSVNYGLKRFSDSLGYLNRANRALGRLEEEDFDVWDLRPALHAVQLELANVKTAMGRREEALGNLRKCLEMELMLEKDSTELGKGHRDLAEAHVALLNFKDVSGFCMKALEIHKEKLGLNSVEVAHDRRLLAVIYTGLEEHKKALEQNALSQRVSKNWGLASCGD